MSRATERTCLVLTALLAMLLANLAWLHGLSSGSAAGSLTGIHTLNSEDTPTYYAWIDQARHGAWLFRQLYTPEPHDPALLNPLFLLTGWLAALFDLSNAGAYHTMRVALGLLCVPAIHLFLRAFLASAAERLAGLFVVLFSGGLGWIWIASGASPASWPLDLWVPESSGFLSLVESPLNLALLILWSLLGVAAVHALGPGRRSAALACTVLAALLVSIRPYAAAVVVALAVTGVAAGMVLGGVPRRRGLAVAGATLVGVALGILPALWALGSGPAFAAWGEASTVAAPGVVALLAGLAGPLVLALPGVRPLLERRSLPGLLILLWPVIVALLVYAPVGPQVPFARKMLDGVELPLGVLAGAGVGRFIAAGASARWARLSLVTVVFAASLPSNAVLLSRDARAFGGGGLPYRMAPCLATVLDTLRELGDREDVVLAPPALGLLVPAFTGHPVVCCHRDQTIEPGEKEAQVRRFYQTGVAPRRELLERWDVRWVLFGIQRAIPADLAESLTPVARSDCLHLHAVRQDQ